MAEPLILHIETATDICSVALSEGDQQLSLVESGPDRSHATLLNKYIRQVYAESGKEISRTDAVAISKGPGSYTGLRIGVSTAKGLAYALEIPLIALGTLDNMAHGALEHPLIRRLADRLADQVADQVADQPGNELLLCPMIDARRMEVYASFFSTGMEVIREVSADVVEKDSYREILDQFQVCFFGNGSEKCEQVLSHPHAHFISGITPSAAQMIAPAVDRYQHQQFEDTAYFEPFYLKDFIATTPKKKVL